MTATNMPKSFARYADRIADIEDLRGQDEGIWVHLANGWRTMDGDTHSIHENTVTECVRELRWAKPCTVPGCCEVKAHA